MGRPKNNEVGLSATGKTENEFEKTIGRLSKSDAYLALCEELCGYREYMFNMLDRTQLGFFMSNLAFKESDTVLDLGCGNGGILRLITEKYGCRGIGVDTLCAPRTDNGGKIRYICGDINDLADYSMKPTIALSVDGLYFGCDLDKLILTLWKMKPRLFYFFYSQYIFDGCSEAIGLRSDKTVLGEALKKAGIAFNAIDFGEDEYKLYKNALTALEKYKDAFFAEGNGDLYRQKVSETKLGLELYEKGRASRYLFSGLL